MLICQLLRKRCNKFVTNCNKNDLNGYNIVIEDNKVTTNLGGIYDFREKEKRN